MSKKTALILACLLAGATPAFAQTSCPEPVAPVSVDGNTVTKAQITAAIAAVNEFMAKSDIYQQCLADNLTAQKATAEKNKTAFDPALQDVVMTKVTANQNAKEKVGADINAAVVLYKKNAAK